MAQFELCGESYCFINCHLEAHSHRTEARNANVAAILSGEAPTLPLQRFAGVLFWTARRAPHRRPDAPHCEFSSPLARSPGLKLGPFPDADALHKFHHTVWLGDLNYRIELEPLQDGQTPR